MNIVEKSQLMSPSEIDRTIQRLAHEIVEKSGGTKHLALIGMRRRGVPLAQRIAQAMRGIDGVEVPVGTLDITLYRDDLSKVASHAVLQSSDITFDVDNMDLVLVDDVLYTGRHDSRGDERSVRSGATETRFAVRVDRSRTSRDADRGAVRGARRADQRHGNYRSAAARNRQRRARGACRPRRDIREFIKLKSFLVSMCKEPGSSAGNSQVTM